LTKLQFAVTAYEVFKQLMGLRNFRTKIPYMSIMEGLDKRPVPCATYHLTIPLLFFYKNNKGSTYARASNGIEQEST
jgi:hypothetical protein